MTVAPTADRNLLFGVIAMQMNFVGRDALVAAMHAWVLDKQKSIGQILLERNQLTANQVRAIDALIVLQMNVHGDDPRRSLQALSTVSSVGPLFADINDPDLQAGLLGLDTTSPGGSSGNGSATSRSGSRFRILRSHARGGLGEVFVAEDTELHREVALKEIQENRADDPGNRSRFILEAEITGGLEHPGIVPVYGLGVHPDGRPYYAMRFIRGDSLKTAIEGFHKDEKPGRDLSERSLKLRQLLRRFTDVCNAIAYAHSRGVLHRDLKPSNVMLGPFGETLVVDWGLAKAGVEPPHAVGEATVDPALRPVAGDDLPATRAGSALGTPTFMSPEQASGKFAELGPASDIYSLGAMLYTLLTGRKPYDGTDTEAILVQVRAGQFFPPRQVKPDTPPALDGICRKAMALNPSDRYASALDLAADVDHWLADEPASAYRDPWTVKVSRWARRHRTKVVAAGVLLVSAVVALSASTALVWKEKRKTEAQKSIALEQKGIAEKNYELARNLSRNSVDLIVAAEAEFAADPAKDKARREILKTASNAFGDYLAERPDDPELQKQTAQIYRYTANVHRLGYQTAAAEPLYRKAIELVRNLKKQSPNDVVNNANLIGTLRDFATHQSQIGRLDDAEKSIREAVGLAEVAQAADAASIPARRNLAQALLTLASNEFARGKFVDSRQTATRAAAIFAELSTLPPGRSNAYDPILRALALNVVAISEREAGNLESARTAHRTAVDILIELNKQKFVGVNKNDVLHLLGVCGIEQSRTLVAIPVRPDVQNLNPWGFPDFWGPVLRGSQQTVKAETNISPFPTMWSQLAAANRSTPMYREWQGIAHQFRGQLRRQLNRPQDARTDFNQSREILEALVADFPQIASFRGELGRTCLELGRLSRAENDAAGAAAAFSKAIAELKKAVEMCPGREQDRQSLAEALAE